MGGDALRKWQFRVVYFAESTPKPCPKTFGERCALQGLPEGVVSPNAAKSASLVTNVPCRPLCWGYFHQTILNNCHKSTTRHSGSSRRYTSGKQGRKSARALANDLKLMALRPLGFSRTSPYRSKLLTALHEKSPALCAELQIVCGEGGIRTPGTFQFNSFQDCRNRPLYHLSFPEKGLQI